MLRLITVCLLTGAILGCATNPPPQKKPTAAPAAQPQAAPQTQQAPAPETPKQPAPQTSEKSPAPTPSPSVESPPAKPKSSGALIQKGQILVTKEKYQKTFEDVRHLIQELNAIIADRNYEGWTQHLTEHYIKTFSDPKTLDELSNLPMMKRQNLRLLTLKDYFLNVVVPSRANAHLDDLEFTSKTQVRAITVIDGKRYILYNLRLENGSWKIAVS